VAVVRILLLALQEMVVLVVGVMGNLILLEVQEQLIKVMLVVMEVAIQGLRQAVVAVEVLLGLELMEPQLEEMVELV